MRDIEKLSAGIIYAEPGEYFTTHAGLQTKWMYDSLLQKNKFAKFIAELNPTFFPAGIELGGYLLAQAANSHALLIRKEGTIYASMSFQGSLQVSLIDDVVTTETSMLKAKEALEAKDYVIEEYLCILDRREEFDKAKTLEIRSIAKTYNFDVSNKDNVVN